MEDIKITKEEEINQQNDDLNMEEDIMGNSENIIDSVIDNIKFDEKSPISKEEFKDIFTNGGDMTEVIGKIYNKALGELFKEEPNLLTLLYTTSPESIYSTPLDTKIGEVEYFLKKKYVTLEIELKSRDNKTTPNGPVEVHRYYTPDVKAIVEGIQNSEIKDKASVINAMLEIIKAIVSMDRPNFIRKYALKANVTAIELLGDLDEFNTNLANMVKDKASSPAISYYKEKLNKLIVKNTKDKKTKKHMSDLINEICKYISGYALIVNDIHIERGHYTEKELVSAVIGVTLTSIIKNISNNDNDGIALLSLHKLVGDIFRYRTMAAILSEIGINAVKYTEYKDISDEDKDKIAEIGIGESELMVHYENINIRNDECITMLSRALFIGSLRKSKTYEEIVLDNNIESIEVE